jgi:gliding motility-associated-like protein
MFKRSLIICLFLTTYLKVYAQIVWQYPPPTYPLTEYCPGMCFDIYDTIIDWQIDTSLFYRHVIIFMRNPVNIFNYTGDFIDTLYVPKSNFRFKYCFQDTGNYVMTEWLTRVNQFGEEYGMYSFGVSYFKIKPCLPIAIFNFIRDTICNNECVLLKDSSLQQPTKWQWKFEGSNTVTFTGKSPPDICFENTGTYPIQLIASNKFGSDTATKNIVVTGCNDCIKTPNAFTPNNDGINDVFKAYNNCFLELFKIQIYNRWSNLVFESDDINNSWNGKYKEIECEPDVYSYLITYKNSLKNKVEFKKGNITLLR